MIIVTGGAGFIGSNLVYALNRRGITDVVVVDNLTQGHKYRNLVDCQIADYLDKEEFLQRLPAMINGAAKPRAVFHQGACSTTTEWDGRYMMANNYSYSKDLLHICATHDIPFIYASSGAVYGLGTAFNESPENEQPLNVYGYSKLLFDQYLRRHLDKLSNQVVGLRYFNVYGPREHHKGGMASVAFHLHQQLLETGQVKLFQGNDGYQDGEQRRDFVYVDDIVETLLWCYEHPAVSGIFNAGTGRSQSFNDVANAVIGWHGCGRIEYIPFPEKLVGCYQSFTQADISALRQAGYQRKFKTVEEGVKAYLAWLVGETSS